MIERLAADRYYDEPYQAGTHVVLLTQPDDLADAAYGPYERVSRRMPAVHFWHVEIGSVADVEAVQALRFPQYRFFRDGSERHAHLGLLDDEQLIECFDHLED